jgi:hypothetical protein
MPKIKYKKYAKILNKIGLLYKKDGIYDKAL